MREEPVLYINGKPYVVREADQPFCNVEYTGVQHSSQQQPAVRCSLNHSLLPTTATEQHSMQLAVPQQQHHTACSWQCHSSSATQRTAGSATTAASHCMQLAVPQQQCHS